MIHRHFSSGNQGLRSFAQTLFLSVGLLLFPTIGLAEDAFEVLEVALAHAVQDREPVDPFSPPAHCEKDGNGSGSVPVIDASITDQVVFWTKIASSSDGTIRHVWHHEVEGHWATATEVDLSIRPSPGYRMWSSKSLFPELHVGEWMIVVSPADDPNLILCITRFQVQ